MSKQIGQLTIGSLRPAGRYFLAPLAGISDFSFRRIGARAGASLVYTEMISAKALDQKNRHTGELLEMSGEEKPVAVQLFGHEPDVMARATEQLEERDFALVDINMGCPVLKVVKNGEGSALLRTPELAAEIVRAVRTSTAKPVTVKMRTGIEGADISSAAFAQMLEEAGADAIAVHGRSREQYYSGQVDLGAIRSVREAVRIPVIGSGDVTDETSAARMFDETGCDAIMIGRGAIGTVYRLDEDTIVKVYNIPDCLPMIENEQKRAKQAFVRGIPTAISYDLVRVGDKFGSVFERVKAENCNDLIVRNLSNMDEIIRLYVSLLKTVHAVEMLPG